MNGRLSRDALRQQVGNAQPFPFIMMVHLR
jgi:hypothetical protein